MSDAAADIAGDCLIPAGVTLERGTVIGPRVVFAGSDVEVRTGAVIEAAAVIANNVVIGQGAVVRAGAVVLHDVPPNAIVAGNPAEVTGYRSASRDGARPEALIRDASMFEGMSAPARHALGIGDSALYLMRRVTDTRGSLTVGEARRELPFMPERYFVIYDVPSRELRGEHAHHACHQFLICLHGSCRVMLDDGHGRCEVPLDQPDLGIHMPPMIWGTQYRYSPEAVLLVFASMPYESSDYIRSYDEFLSASRTVRR